MAEKTARGRFVPWSMTKAQLESQNPVPIAGEMVFESDTGRKKIGNGTSAWNALPYVAADNTGAAPASHASSATTYGAASATNYGHAKASAAVPASAGTAAVGTDNAQYARGDHIHPAQTSVTGNAGTATKLATARAINVSGDVTGAAQNFDGSGAITIPTTLANVATAGTTGETANKTIGFGSTFIVPQLTINAKGLTTAVAARTMTMSSESNGVRLIVPVSQTTYRYKWLGMGVTGYYFPLFPDEKTDPATVAGTWTVSSSPIVPTSPILSNESIATLNANSYASLRMGAWTNALYNLNVASISNGPPVYLKGTIQLINGRELFVLAADSYFTQALPTSKDGYVYWNIGGSASATAVQLNAVQPIYYYSNGIRLYVPGRYFDTLSSANGEVVCYVSPTGSDTETANTGLTSSAPMKTIGAAMARYSYAKSLRIYLRSGTHTTPGAMPLYAPFTRLTITGSGSGKENVIFTGTLAALSGPSIIEISQITMKMTSNTTSFYIAAYDTSLLLSRVDFDNVSSLQPNYCLALNNCRAHIDQCTFSNFDTVVYANYSDVSLETTTIDNTCTRGLFSLSGSCIRSGNSVTNNAAIATFTGDGSSVF